jgi:hypothetical protein
MITISRQSLIIFRRNVDHDQPGIVITIVRNRRYPSFGIRRRIALSQEIKISFDRQRKRRQRRDSNPPKPTTSIHRVSRSLPRLDAAFQHLDVRKALLLVFRCLTDSAGFAGSSSIEDDFLRLWQRGRAGLELDERYGPFQI